MSVRDVFSAHLVIQEEQTYPSLLPLITEDITSGIMNVDIVEGNDVYEGPWQQIDTGQFTIVTRNPNMDPEINPNVKYNARIEFRDSRSFGGTFFSGYITDINVEYQRNNDPLITITGTDILGVFQRTIVTQEMYDAIVNYCTTSAPALLETGIDFEFFMYFVDLYILKDQTDPLKLRYPVRYGFVGGAPGLVGALPGSEGVLAYRPAAYFPKVGETILEVINKYAETNLDYFSLSPYFLEIYPLAKYNGAYWPPVQDPALEFTTYQFSSDPADNKPYESILIDNGYNRTINQIEVSNESRFFEGGELVSETNNFGDYTVQESAQGWAETKARLSTILDVDHANDAELERYATDIFQIIAFPSDEIQQITFNNGRYQDIEDNITRSFNRINQFVRIKHKVNNTKTIDRFYDIAGITHNISPDEWVMGYTLKPSQQEIAFTYQGQVPTLQMNALTGDSNFNFTATITDYPVEDIDYVLWDLNQIDANEVVYYYPSAFSGEKFRNGLKRTGLTQTWNFDDDGILAPYSSENPFGGYGSGNWWVTAYLFLKNGFTIAVQQEIVVGTPEVEADFIWSQNLTNNFGQVTFTNTSVNHETGEPDSYLWNFGDGTTSTLQNPVKTYVPTGSENSYSVSLRVFAYGPGGTKVFNTKTQTVTLTQPTMNPNFTWVESPAGTIVFTNTSTNVGFEEPDAYFWQFGDGNTSTLKNPTHTYVAPPTVSTDFSVTLTTRNIWEQTASVTKTITVSPLYFAGTLPVNELRVVRATSTNPATPIMAYLRALRSDNVDLSFNATTTRANQPNQIWAQSNNTVPPLSGTNLTRNPATSSGIYGLKFSSGTPTDFSLNTPISQTQNIASIKMLFDDKFPIVTYPSYEWDRYYLAMNDSFGGTFPVGYWDLPAIPNFLPRQSFGRDYAMTPIRPMPPRIPYFKYTFNNRTVSFTSMETADSYAWNFGDGTTSTLKNPVKTYSSQGTYNVSLAVTNGGLVTRTTTEPVIVEALVNYPVRYIKFAQKEHTGLNAWDTPYVSDITPICNRNQIQQTTPQSILSYSLQPISIAKSEGYSMEWYPGTVSPDQPGPTSPMNPLSTGDNRRPWVSAPGLRVKSLDGTFRTKWELVGDLGVAVSNINKFTAQFSRWSNRDGTPNPVCTGISYEVYVTDYVGLPSGIASATWTKIGEFNPTGMALNNNSFYTMTPL